MAAKSKSAKAKADYGDRLLARNKRASFDYELGDTYEAGLVLVGSEVRSLRENTADITDSWVEIKNGEAYVNGLRIPILKHAAYGHSTEKRRRKLLLNRAELLKLQAALDRDRMTLISTKLYFKNGRAKLEIALGKGKQTHDKRQSLREKDAAKEARDAIRKGKGY